jgi:hypothetical protein
VSVHETPLTLAYWEALGEGTLYEEFPVVTARRGVQTRRAVDGLVVLGTPARRVSTGADGRSEHSAADLDGKDLVVIQTKATRLNPYVFGQALLSMDLIRQRWSPRSLRSVLICVRDDPELWPIAARYPGLEVRVVRPPLKEQSFSLNRLPGAVATVAVRLGGFPVSPARVGSHVNIDGVVILHHRENGAPLQQAVPGREVVSVHTHFEDGAARMGMYIGGEVIMAQALLTQMGAASVRSVIVAHCPDEAIKAALTRHADFEVQRP